MVWQTLRALKALLGCLALAACASVTAATKPAEPVYDVRSAVVVSGPNIPPALLTATNGRVNAAIAATTRDAPLPRVVLTIRVVEVKKAQGFNNDRNTAKIAIDATSVDTGSVIGIASFETTTIAPDPSVADDLMAEDIAARVRSTFALKTPGLSG